MRKVKIGILHCPNTYNYGSMMLGENVIYYLNQMLREKEIEPIFLIYTSHLENIDRLKRSTGCQNIEMRKEVDYGKKIINRKFQKIFEILKFIIVGIKNTKEYKNVLECDFLLVLGGDDLSEYYNAGKMGALINLLNIYFLGPNNIFLISQTIGPFSKYNKIIASKVLNSVKFPIYIRDKKNVNYCKNILGLKNVVFSSDLGFLDLAKQKNKSKRKKYITFVVSGLASQYSNSLNNYIKSIEKIICYLQKKRKDKEEILLLPHVISDPYGFGKRGSDRMMIKKIIDKNNFLNVKPVFSDLLPYQARDYFSQSRFVLSGRMHGCISSFQVGTPAIALSYSVKYGGLMDFLGFPELVIECANSLEQKLPIIKKKIDLLDKKSGIYNKEINLKMKEIKISAKKSLKNIAEVISNKDYFKNKKRKNK